MEAPELGALNVPLFVIEPAVTLFVPQASISEFEETVSTPEAETDCVSVTVVNTFVLTVRFTRDPLAGISRPVDCEPPV